MALYVHETGPLGAPSIVFLHGIGVSGWMWNRQIAALPDFHCLNVDLPGHGRSNQAEWRSLSDTAILVAEVIREHTRCGRAHVVGLSLGGQVALALLERHADLLDHVVVSGVTVSPMPNRVWLRPQLWLTSALIKRHSFADQQAKSLRLGPGERAELAASLQAVSMQAYRRIMEEVVDYTAPATLGHVTVPTLVAAGGHESQIILDAVRDLPRLMPNSQGRLAPGVGHGWNVEAPELFSAMIRAWITDAPLPSSLRQYETRG